jgi:predicted membrane protein
MEEHTRRVCPAAWENDGGSITPGLIVGLAIVAIGVLFLLDNFGVPVGIVWHYWPAIIIAIGLAKVIDAPNTAGRTGGGIIMIVGLVLIADQIHLPFLNNVSLWSLWPLALIAVGGMMLWGAVEGKGMATPWMNSPASPEHINVMAIFGGGKRRITGEFKGGDLVAIFGGYEIDLRNATMSADEAILNINCIFGGFEIKIPETWSTIMQVTGVFGGHDDSTRQPDPRLVPNPKRIIIRGVTMVGGMSAKN